MAGRARSASTSTSCWSTATSRPSRSRPRPTTWPRRSSPAATSPGSPVGDPDRGRRRVAARRAASWPRTTRSSLCNIAQFTEAEVAALDDYLKQGGGVVVFGGDQVVADNYNRLLYADGKGLLPAAIGAERRRRRRRRSRRFGFNPLGFKHPIVEPLRGRAGPGHGGPDRGQDLAVPQAQAPRGLAGAGRPGVRQRRPRRRSRRRGTGGR